MEKINSKNVKSFLLGNLNYYKNKIIGQPQHLKEQYYYRLYNCKDDCLISGRCKVCNCPTLKKAWSPGSCNLERHPNFMAGQEWEDYKIAKNINNIEELIKEVEDAIHSN